MSKKNNLVLFVDVETNGLPIKKAGLHTFYPFSELDKYDSSRLIAVSWCICDFKGDQTVLRTVYVKPDGFTITNSDIHGISQEKATKDGVTVKQLFDQLEQDLTDNVKVMVAHNLEFDYNIMMSELHRLGNKKTLMDRLQKLEKACTAEQTRDLLKLPTKSTYGGYKMPSLKELYFHSFKKEMVGHHDPEQDVIHLKEIFFHLLKH
jgi:DNA polymerase III epsilon subunit-like protein